MFRIREAQVETLAASVLRQREPWKAFVSTNCASDRPVRVELDALGLPRSVTTKANRTFSFSHDKRGRLATLAIPQRDTLRFEYDASASIVRIFQGAARYSFEHNKQGKITGITYPDRRQYRFEYLPGGVIHKLVDRAGGVKTFRYDDAGHLKSFSDPLGRETVITGQPSARVTFPDGSSEQVQLDAKKQVLSRLLRDGTSVQITPGAGRPSEIRWSDGQATQFSYTPHGLLQETTGSNGSVRFEYDDNGNTSSETVAEGKTRCRFDSEGRLLELTSPAGDSIEYRYDSDGVLESIQAWGTCLIRFVSGTDGQIKEIHFGKEIVERRQFGAAGRMEEAQVTGPGGAVISRQSYRYDSSERLTSLRDASIRSNAPRDFLYDAEDRLIEDRNGTNSQSFTYDAAGNMLRVVARDSERQFEVGPMDAPIRCGSRKIEYDGVGRITHFSVDKGSQRLEHDGRGLLTRYCCGQRTIRFEYDALGRRTRKIDGAAVWKFGWFGQQLLWEEYCLAGSAPVRREYVFLPGTFVPVAFRENGRVYFMQIDARGAVIRTIDLSGQVVWHGEYSSFGIAGVRVGRVRQPFRLLGHYHDEETGLQYTIARYYSPDLACYLARDPRWAESFATNYSYARNDPWNRVDPTGGFPALLPVGVARAVDSVAQSVSDAGNYLGSGDPAMELFAGAALAAAVPVGLVTLAAVGVPAASAFFADLADQVLSGEPVSVSCAANAAGAAAAASAAVLGSIALAGVNQIGKVFGFGDSGAVPPGPSPSSSDLAHAQQMALLANAVYQDDGAPPGYKRLSDSPNRLPEGLKDFQFDGGPSGLHAAIFQKDSDGSITVAYRGTDNQHDIVTDVKQAMGLPSDQYEQAAVLAQQVQAAYPDNPIEFTGHSLGGGMAHLASTVTGLPATTFNAAGVSDNTIDRYGGDDASADVTNYVIQGEVLSTAQSQPLLPLPDATGNNVAIQPRNVDGSIPSPGALGADWHKMSTILPSLDYAAQNAKP